MEYRRTNSWRSTSGLSGILHSKSVRQFDEAPALYDYFAGRMRDVRSANVLRDAFVLLYVLFPRVLCHHVVLTPPTH